MNNPVLFIDPDGRYVSSNSAYNAVGGQMADEGGNSGEPVFDSENKTLTINANIIFYGDAASDELATQTASNIQNAWNKEAWQTENGWTVQFSVTGSYAPNITAAEIAGNTDLKNNYIKVVDTDVGPSYMTGGRQGPGSNTGVWRLKDIQGSGSTTAAHEFGHMMGLVQGSRDGHPPRDQRGKGAPEIMAARGSWVDSKFQYDPKASPGAKGGTINPRTRVVKPHNVGAVINNMHVRFKNGKLSWGIGHLTNKSY